MDSVWDGEKNNNKKKIKKGHLYKNVIFKRKSDTKSYLFCSCFPQKASTLRLHVFVLLFVMVRKTAFKTRGRGGNIFSSPLGLVPSIVHTKISTRKGEKTGGENEAKM